MSSESRDPVGDDSSTTTTEDGQTDDWTVNVDVFDVSLSFRVSNGNARVVSSNCNCDINRETCRHVAIAEGRVQAVFQNDDPDGVRGRITHAPSLWRPLVDEEEEVATSDAAVQ